MSDKKHAITYPEGVINPIIDRHPDGCLIEKAYGINIRQHFAAMAMQGLMSNHSATHANDIKEIAERAVRMADALIEELNK
jgi:hypothetical protein